MKALPLVGPRIRDRRRALGITQAALAASLGISASYLNLIEGGRRRIAGVLLKRIADALSMGIDELDGAAERRLLSDLAEVAAEPLMAELGLDPGTVPELASRHPEWARALVAMHRAWVDRGRAVSALSDRLRHDPFLPDAVHQLLTRVAAIKSSAEIIQGLHDVPADRLQRFAEIVGSDSQRLAEQAQVLAAYFERAHTSVRSVTPVGEVDDFLADHDHHFPELEAAARSLRAAIGLVDGATDDAQATHAALAGYVADAQGGQPLSPHTPLRTLAVQAARLFCGEGVLADELARARTLTHDAARHRAAQVLTRYVADAMLMPYDAFLAAARRLRFDAEALGRAFGVGFAAACERLVTLRREGAQGIPFALMGIDAAGCMNQRAPLPDFPMPRHGSACPLWAAYQALQSPGTVVRQLVEFPGGARFLLVARTVEEPGPGFPMPRRLGVLMLACDALHADQTVYADGLDVSAAGWALPVGANCRICTRTRCSHRQEDPVIGA